MQAWLLPLVSVVLTFYPQPWGGSHLNIVSDAVFAVKVSLWWGIHFIYAFPSFQGEGWAR